MRKIPSLDVRKGVPIYEVWSKYEDITMHFNDLLIKLRIQALGGVAALSTLVGIFTKTDFGNVRASWEVATGVFFGLCLFWIAIWLLDILYYNRLLIGSVTALLEVEAESKSKTHISEITLSTKIEQAVWNKLPPPGRTLWSRIYLLRGVLAFYVVVMASLVAGFLLCLNKYQTSTNVSARLRQSPNDPFQLR